MKLLPAIRMEVTHDGTTHEIRLISKPEAVFRWGTDAQLLGMAVQKRENSPWLWRSIKVRFARRDMVRLIEAAIAEVPKPVKRALDAMTDKELFGLMSGIGAALAEYSQLMVEPKATV